MMVNISILLLCALCLAYAGLNAYALLRANTLIFPAPPSSYTDDPSILKLGTADGNTVSAYHLPAAGSVSERNPLLIYSHGNAEDIGTARPFLELFQQRGIPVLAYDYPGYGTSSGKPSETGCYAAIEAAYAYAIDELGYRPSQIILYGRSLGSGPSTWLAEREPVGGLILDGAFTSTFRVLTEAKLLLWDRFDNYARLPSIQCPVLIIHGTEDRTVPFTHAGKNWTRLQGTRKKLFVDGADHSNLIEIAGNRYWATVMDFLQSKNP